MWRAINLPFVVLVLVSLAMPAEARDRTRDPVAHNPGSWFGDDDYPEEAKRANQSGAVRFDVTVSADGKPESCRILESSGSKALDDQTCAIVMERGQFDPALDRKGTPVRGDYVQRTRWTLADADPEPLPGPFRSASVLRIDRSGAMLSCTDEAVVGVVTEKMPSCADMKSSNATALLTLRGGSEGPSEVTVTFETAFVPDGAAVPAMTYRGANRTQIALDVVHFDIDDQGKAVNCRTIERFSSPSDLCDGETFGQFVVAPGGPRGATMTVAMSRPDSGK